MPDRPGALAGLLSTLAETDANVLDVVHTRVDPQPRLDEVDVPVQIETRGTRASRRGMARLRGVGYVVTPADRGEACIAVVTARAAVGTDEDDPLLLAALAGVGAEVVVVPWDDRSGSGRHTTSRLSGRRGTTRCDTTSSSTGR